MNVHFAPSYTFSDKIVLYGGLGITFLHGSAFFVKPYYYSYWQNVSNAWGDMFSKIIGFEFSPSERLVFNFEYVNTRANNFASIKTGMKF